MVKKILIAVVVLAILFWGGLWLAVKIALPPEKVKELVHKHGSEALGRDVYVDGASIGIFPLIKIKVSGVKIANGEGFSEDPLFNLKEMILALDFMSVFKMSPIIKEIRLVDLDLLYEVNKKGKTNIDGLGGEKKEEKTEEAPGEIPTSIPSTLAIKGFVIENARVRYRDQKSGQVVTLGSINQNVSLSVDKNLEDIRTEGELVVSSISVSDEKMGLRKGDVRIFLKHKIGVNLAKQVVTIENVDFGFQDIQIGVQGIVNDFLKDQIGLDVKIASNEIKMASLLKEVPPGLSPDIPKLSAKGHAKFNASVAGILDTASLPKVQAEISLHELGFSHSDLPAALKDLNGLIQITENSVEIKDFGFLMDQHPVSVAMRVVDLLEIPTLEHFGVDASLDLGKVAALADKFVGLPEGFSLEGFVNSKIQASGLLDPQNPTGIKAEGDIQLKDIVVKAAELPEKVQINGSVKINNDKIDEKLMVRIANSDVDVNVNITNYLAMALPELAKGKTTSIKVGVRSKLLDLDKLLPTPSSDKPVEAEPSDPLTSYPSLPPVVVDMDINLGKTKVMDLEMTDYSQKVSIKNSVVASTLKGQLYTGSFNQDLNVDLRDTTSAKVVIKMKVNRVEANDFISRVNDKIPPTNAMMQNFLETDSTIYGKFSMDMNVSTFGLPQDFPNNLVGDIDVKVENGKLMNVGMIKSLSDGLAKVHKSLALPTFSFEKLDAQLEAKDGRLIVKHADIKRSPVGAFSFTGSIGFDNTLAVNADQVLTPQLSGMLAGASNKASSAVAKSTGISALAGVSAFPQDEQGNVLLYHLFTGTMKNPKYGLDKERMATGAQDQAKEALKAAAQAKLDEAKAKLDAEKQKLMDEANKKKEEAEAKINAEKQKIEAKAKAEKEKAEAEAKNKAKSEGKKALKKLGF